MKIRPVGAEFLADGRTDGQTDGQTDRRAVRRTKLLFAFRSFANAPKH